VNRTTDVLNPRHGDRPVTRVTIDGGAAIRKRYRDDSTPVYAAMVELWHSPFGEARPCPGIPAPLAHDAQEGTIDMRTVDGEPLTTGGALLRRPALRDQVALLLADLHRSGVQVARRRDPAKVIRQLARRLEATEQSFIEPLRRLAPADETLCLGHGDFSPPNVIVTADGPVLIDLDRLQMAGPGRDVNYLGAWCWVTATLGRDRSVDDAWGLCDAFEAAYLTHRPEAASDLVAGRAFHRAAGLLRIATEWSVLRSDPVARTLVFDEARRFALMAN
jgi:hypothetical protein